jgi:hypothetical protein
MEIKLKRNSVFKVQGWQNLFSKKRQTVHLTVCQYTQSNLRLRDHIHSVPYYEFINNGLYHS